MRVLVTGATGLVGCHLTARLSADGHCVRALVRDPDKLLRVIEPLGVDPGQIEAVRGDVLEPESISSAAAGCDAAIHCAGFYSNEPDRFDAMTKTNVDGTQNVLAAAVEAALDPVVHVSSMLALFPPPGKIMRADDPVTTPHSAYARSKADAERIARRFQSEGAPVVCVYPASVQGPCDPTVLAGASTGPSIIARALRSGRALVTQGGLAYTDARDLARVLAATLEPGRGPRRYLFGGSFLTHTEYHALLCELTGRELKADRLPGALLRLMGRIGSLRHRLFGTEVELNSEAAWVLTRSVPTDDSPVKREFGIEAMPARDSFADMLRWMFEVGFLEQAHVGELATPSGAEVAPREG